MADGKVVFHGTPAQLTLRGEGHGVGDAPLVRLLCLASYSTELFGDVTVRVTG